MPEPERVRLFGGPGKKLGQQTGADAEQNAAEALKLLAMIGPHQDNHEVLSFNQTKFVKNMLLQACFPLTFHLSGKQLFYLRDIKDKLIEAGVL